MNSGFANLRASLPMNLKRRFPGHKVWAGAQPDIDRIADTASPLPHMLPTPEDFAHAVGALGISNADTVVVYDGAGVFSAPARRCCTMRCTMGPGIVAST